MGHFLARLVLVALCSGLFGCSHNNGFENYRSNPFQFPYPEYHLKADVIEKMGDPGESGPVRMLDLFGLEASIDTGFFDEMDAQFVKDGQVFLKKGGKPVLLLNYHEEALMGCESEAMKTAYMDFCSAFDSTREFNEKLFLLTPGDLRDTHGYSSGNLWIIHKKGYVFEHTDKIYMYRLDGLTAFRQDLKDGKVQLHLFPDKIAPDFISAVFMSRNETIIDQLISSIIAGAN